MGRHAGLLHYTVGQRQGLGIGGRRRGEDDDDCRTESEAWYVVGKDLEHNRLIVVQGHDHPALFYDHLAAMDLNWISGIPPHCNWVYSAKTRYRQKDAPCTLVAVEPEHCVIEFAEPQWAVTPGQSVVVYESTVCLGGGIIHG